MTRIKTIEDIDSALTLLIKSDTDLAHAHQTVCSAGIKVPLRLRPGGFSGLSEIVISQLVSKASASAIHQRFKTHISTLTPDNCLSVDDETWRAIGMSRAKQATLRAIATAINNRSLNLDILADLQVDQAVKHLTAIKGIGQWTADVYLLFCVGHPDIFPSGDLALREAARIILSLEHRPPDKDLRNLASRWSPWRGVAARLLWAFYAVEKYKRAALP
ncbi:MAG: DNA-3-methyladenine glycosylase 2 family protein [Hyphomicrobiales bacterium]|nr:DNA-3-methyladenine glycosylase 2 family protein [Hyphomicrobiales bacterium]